jgi:hypothetical protein
MEILTKTPINGSLWDNHIILSVVMVFAFICTLGFIFGFAPLGSIRDKISTVCMWTAFIGVIGCFVWLLLNAAIPGAPTGRYKYEVKISDTTTFKEVTDNYKIIDNRGQIWVLEDKDD